MTVPASLFLFPLSRVVHSVAQSPALGFAFLSPSYCAARHVSRRLRGAARDRAAHRAGAARQLSLRHRPAAGGQGPVRQRHQSGQRAESHDRLLHGLQPHHPAGSHLTGHSPGQAGRQGQEESPHRGAPVRVPAVPARSAPGCLVASPAAADVRRGRCLRPVRRLQRLLARCDDAGVAALHGGSALNRQCPRLVPLRQPDFTWLL